MDFKDIVKVTGHLANGIAKGMNLDSAAIVVVKDGKAMICFGASSDTTRDQKKAIVRKVGEYMVKMCDCMDQGDMKEINIDDLDLTQILPVEKKEKPTKKKPTSFEDFFNSN